MRNNAFLIAAPQSGSGKTIVALAIMAALRRRGLAVAPFKCGPDFIDPGYHCMVTGRSSINLDGWMCPEAFVAETFHLHTVGADIAVIEGVMGLFDGLGASSNEGSSAQIAVITGSPVVLVVNSRGMAASAAALVKGFADYDPRIRLAGVIFNNVGSESHGLLLKQSLNETLPQIAVIGCIPRDESLTITSRHLGLVTAEDNPLPMEYLEKLADLAEDHLDLEALVGLETVVPFTLTAESQGGDSSATVRIGVARDAAFCFVYEDNLRLLREAGAEIVLFSPLDERELPSDLSGIYLPGGYPELYADRLTSNTAMRSEILAAVKNDMPVYAECGGFIYLTEGMEASESVPSFDFVGVFPVRARMLSKRKALGYRQVVFATDSVIAAAGGDARGHEFHYSEIEEMPAHVQRCFRVTRQGQELGGEGYRFRNCLASYIHLHFGSHTAIAPAFVAACRKFRISQVA